MRVLAFGAKARDALGLRSNLAVVEVIDTNGIDVGYVTASHPRYVICSALLIPSSRIDSLLSVDSL